MSWAVERAAGRTPEPSDASLRTFEPAVTGTTAPQDFREEAPAKRAASKKAAVVAPALGLSEAEVVDDEPLLDPATVKAAASEAEMMRRAADPDKG